jgi:hypothetical protein
MTGGTAPKNGTVDIVLTPEMYGPDWAVAYGHGIKKVVLNQICGCLEVSFHGGEGCEFFRSKFYYPIEQGDIINFARTVQEVVIKAYRENPEYILKKGEKAAAYIQEHHSPKLEEQEVIAAWQAILSNHQQRAQQNA